MKRPVAALLLSFLIGCASTPPPTVSTAQTTRVEPTEAQLRAAAEAGLTGDELALLLAKPLYKMKPDEVGRYLKWLRAAEPNFRARIAHLGRKNIGQPYEIYLLGEFPYETTDAQPLFNLEKSDCVVFAEHTYAMALSQSWPEFFWMLQRIRYRDGVIGVTTRNHYTETDWNRANQWLVKDITTELGGARTATYPLTVDRTKFFKTRYQLEHSVPIENTVETYIPRDAIKDLLPQLQEGDFVNIISTRSDGKSGFWASHVGLVVVVPDGTRHFLHSAEPAVREETFDAYIARAVDREARNAAANKTGQVLAGFKFLRLVDHPEVPPMAPQPRPR
jgi:hypothetical protein